MALSAGDPPPAAEVDAPPARAPELTIIYSAGLEGYLTPCGCDEGQTGGLAAWATVADEARRSAGGATVWIDGGDVADSAVRVPYVLEAYRELGCDLVCLSPRDVALGIAAAASGDIGLAFASAAEAPVHTIRTGDYRVRAQVVAPDTPCPQCPGGADAYALVRRADLQSNLAWAAGTAAWDAPVVVLGDPAEEPMAEISGQIAVVQGAPRGGSVVAVDLAARDGRLVPLDVRRTAVSDKAPRHPVVQRVADRYYREQQGALQAADDAPDPAAALEERGVALAVDCRPCHQSAYEVWQASRHARAFETLRSRGRLVAECVACHSQAYRDTGQLAAPAAPTGEQSLTCMACHGAATTHAMTGDPQFITRPASEAACTPCHRAPHITGPFDWEAGRERIRHW